MSAITSLPFNPSKSDPNLTDALNLLKKDILLSFSAHHVATIQSFDATKQTAKATVNYKKTNFKLNKATGLYDAVLVDYPILLDCPVICLGGGTAALTFPIKTGDECLVCFNDRDLDNWFQGAGGGGVATARLHSFSDGIILVGLRSLANVLTNYDLVRAVLRNGQALVGVGPTLVKIANNTTTLNTLLQNLLTQLQNIIAQLEVLQVTGVTAGGTISGAPVNAAAFAAIGANLSTISTQISGLLE